MSGCGDGCGYIVTCPLRAEQHGEEMLSLISRTLTSSYQDALQVAMATEGVVLLCEHEVVDVVTVWGVLGREGRLASDNRYSGNYVRERQVMKF